MAWAEMNLPEPIENFIEVYRQPWKPVATAAAFIAAFLYAWFLLYAFTHSGDMFFIDNVNLPIHEGGHIIFGMFGWEELMVWGGPSCNCWCRSCWRPASHTAARSQEPPSAPS